MLTLQEAIRQAGLIPVDAEVHLDNYLYDVLSRDSQGKISIAEPLAQLTMRPWENVPSNLAINSASVVPKVSLIYFWMPGCENCISGMNELQRVSVSERFPTNFQVAFVATEIDVTQSVADDMNSAGLAGPVFVDSKGAIAERLAVLGSPALVLVDEKGTVVARFNGEVEFDSPGFDLLMSKIKSYGDTQSVQPGSARRTLADAIRSEVKMIPEPAVTFLSIPVFGFFFIGAFAIICYCIGKSVMRHRKISLKGQK